MINNAGYHGFIELGNVGDKVQITNNLMLDCLGLGVDQTDDVRISELEAHGETDTNGKSQMVWVGSIPNDSSVFEISNNIYTVTSDLQSFYTAKNIDEGPSTILTDHIKEKLGDAASTAWVKKDFVLTNIPASMVDLFEWYWSATGADKQKVSTSEYNYDQKDKDYWLNTFNAAYTVTDPDFMGSDNVPVGDPMWTSVVNSSSIGDTKAGQSQMACYPNPFTNFAVIEFNLEKPSTASFEIYDVAGKLVRIIEAQNYMSGTNSVQIEKDDLMSGIYILNMRTVDYNDIIRFSIK